MDFDALKQSTAVASVPGHCIHKKPFRGVFTPQCPWFTQSHFPRVLDCNLSTGVWTLPFILHSLHVTYSILPHNVTERNIIRQCEYSQTANHVGIVTLLSPSALLLGAWLFSASPSRKGSLFITLPLKSASLIASSCFTSNSFSSSQIQKFYCLSLPN